MTGRPVKLSRASLALAVAELSRRDSDLAAVIEAHGPPPLWRRKQGFATLLFLILEQQVSLASARATYARLVTRLEGEPEPARFLTLGDDDLKAIGFSRQKMRYGRALAEAVAGGSLKLTKFPRKDEETVKGELMQLPGIGHWTADVYLMEALGRPDVWPVGDLALAVGAQQVKHLTERPGSDALMALGEAWRPWRAVAARILWHYYLSVTRKPRGA